MTEICTGVLESVVPYYCLSLSQGPSAGWAEQIRLAENRSALA